MSRNNSNQPSAASVGAATSSDDDEAAYTYDDSTDDNHEDASYVPLNCSWIVELEKAHEDLHRGGRDSSSSSNKKPRKGIALQAYRRMCRAYMKLRQWERVMDAADHGLEVCTAYHSTTITKRSRVAEWEKCFRNYRNRATSEWSDEQELPTRLQHRKVRQILDAISQGQADPNKVVLRPHGVFHNSNFLQEAALTGDLLLLEEIVARGAAVDYPFMNEQPESATYRPPVVAPHDATALVAVCCNLVLAFSGHHPALDLGRSKWWNMWCGGKLHLSVLCAMQLVRFGADPTRTLNVSNSQDSFFDFVATEAGLDGMSALDLVRLLRQNLMVPPFYLFCLDSLIELMEDHVRYSAVERANHVECRCGSRLPWMSCHGGVAGEKGGTVSAAPPPHFCVLPELGSNVVVYRLSPRARCPCHRKTTTSTTTALTHYECCWKDATQQPLYTVDTSAQVVTVNRIAPNWPSGRVSKVIQKPEDGGHGNDEEPLGRFVDADAASLIWSPPFQRVPELFANEGPKSKWETWDPDVYAGCVRQLDGHLFLWKDLHSNLNESELLEREIMWNEALERYCDDNQLAGQRRERVISTHQANPCGPCGRVGCDAFETKVREFPRCSRCKSIAYCGRRCQKLDWAEHKKKCSSV